MKDRGSERQHQTTPDDVSWALHKLLLEAAAMDVSLGQRLGLNHADYQAMKHLMTSEGPLGTVELGTLVGLTSGSATGLVDRLERAGHLIRHRDPHDRRRLILQPTSGAVEMTRAEIQPLLDRLQELLETYSDEERRALAGFLNEAIDIYRSYGKPEMQGQLRPKGTCRGENGYEGQGTDREKPR